MTSDPLLRARFAAGRIGRVLQCLVMPALLLLLPALASADISLDARIGFGQSASSASHYRQGSWTPVAVYLTGQGARGVGRLTVTVHQAGHATAYTRRITLHDGPINESYGFVFDLRPVSYNLMMRGNTGTDLSVQLVLDGRELAKKRFAMPQVIADESFNILALTRDGSGMNFLAKKKLGLIHRGVNPTALATRYGANIAANPTYNLLQQVASSALFYTDPRALPSMAQGYAMIDAVALADQPLDNLTEDQTAALQQYVRDGGLMIISGGGDLSRLKSQFYQDLLPITPSSAVVVRESAPELAALENRYRQPLALHDGVALTVGTLRPGAYTLFGPARGSTGYGLVAARPYGDGFVVFTAYDFLSPEFRGWKQTPSLWRDILRCGNQSLSPRATLSNQAHFGYQNGNRALVDAMAGKQASSSPGFPVVAGFLGAYLFLLIPASYWFLKKLDKRELAWFTAPALVLAFTVVAYLIALSIKGASLTVNRIVVLEAQANTDQVAGYGQMTIYSPQRAAYDIALGGAGDAGRPYRSAVPAEIFELSEANIGDMTVEHDQTTVIRGAEVRLWDKRSFDTPVYTSLGGTIEVKAVSLGGDRVDVTVTNRTRFALNNCALVNDKGQNLPLGSLAPGETRKAPQTLNWAYRESATSVHLPAAPADWQYSRNINNPRAETPEQVRNGLRYAVTEALGNNAGSYPNYNNYNAMMGEESAEAFGKATNAFVGWIDAGAQPLLNVRLNDKTAAGAEVDLLYVHLPPVTNLPPDIARFTNPFAADPILNLKDEATRPVGSFAQ